MSNEPHEPLHSASMTEFEQSAIVLLESIDQRLSSIAESTDHLRRFVEGIERMQAAERNFRLGR